jgi:kynurenine formamidase
LKRTSIRSLPRSPATAIQIRAPNTLARDILHCTSVSQHSTLKRRIPQQGPFLRPITDALDLARRVGTFVGRPKAQLAPRPDFPPAPSLCEHGDACCPPSAPLPHSATSCPLRALMVYCAHHHQLPDAACPPGVDLTLAMHVIDLTRPIESGMPISTRVDNSRVILKSRYVEIPDEFAVTRWEGNLLRIDSHTGTHVDAPRCINVAGNTIDAFPVERFVQTPAIRIDVRHRSQSGAPITIDDVEPSLSHHPDSKALLLWTSMDDHWGTPAYSEKHPYLSQDTADYLMRRTLP